MKIVLDKSTSKGADLPAVAAFTREVIAVLYPPHFFTAMMDFGV